MTSEPIDDNVTHITHFSSSLPVMVFECSPEAIRCPFLHLISDRTFANPAAD
jgi:hypothetical protein